jgi:alanine-glyoxylate transaminase / serine-glyoxylate transaminase / serine-pyruvate transaminase
MTDAKTPRRISDWDSLSLPELMIAGPGELHPQDLEILGRQVVAHYGDIWTDLHEQTVDAVGRIMGADKPYIMPGSGTAGLDAAIFNLFEPGQRVVVPGTGFFGGRLMELARQHGLEVTEIEVDVGRPVDPAQVEAELEGADGVITVHVETATGVRHPIEEIARVAHDAGAVCVVDGIASVGGEVADVEKMGLDALVTASQKGLEAAPGLGIVALSATGRERVAARSRRPESWYLDLHVWDWYRREWGGWHPHPVTMPSNLVLSLLSSIQRMEEVGLEAWVAARADLAKRCREGLRDLGLEPIPAAGAEANLVVAAWADDPGVIQKHLLEHERIMISGGLTPVHGRAIRVGLMGRTATEEMVDRMLAGVGAALKS